MKRLPDDVTNPTPLFKEWQDWAKKCSPRYSAELSLMSAICTFGCIMGRRFEGPTGLRANTYTMVLAMTGAGKDAVKRMGIALMRRLRREECIGASKWGSDAGMINEINNSREIIWYADEFSAYLHQWRNPQCSGYMLNIKTMLLEWFNGEDWKGKCLKDLTEVPEVKAPHPSVFAMCQPEVFRKGITMDLVENGLLGRFLYAHVDGHVRKTAQGCDPASCVPDSLVKHLQELLGESENPLTAFNRLLDNDVRIMRYKPEDLHAIEQLDLAVDLEAEVVVSNTLHYSLRIRTFEKMLRIAMVYEWSRGSEQLTLEGMTWAHKVVAYSNECITDLLTGVGDTNEFEKTKGAVLRALAKGPAGMSRLLEAASWSDTEKMTRVLDNLSILGRIDRERNRRGTFTFSLVKNPKETE